MLLEDLIEGQRHKGGIHVPLLDPGTKLIARTRNSVYEMRVVDGREVDLAGGTRPDGTARFPDPVRACFNGSTWGGSAIKAGWVGQDMCLEFVVPGLGLRGVLTTSPVRDLTVVSPDGEHAYPMGWATP